MLGELCFQILNTGVNTNIIRFYLLWNHPIDERVVYIVEQLGWGFAKWVIFLKELKAIMFVVILKEESGVSD